jgi:hypothetical protein
VFLKIVQRSQSRLDFGAIPSYGPEQFQNDFPTTAIRLVDKEAEKTL